MNPSKTMLVASALLSVLVAASAQAYLTSLAPNRCLVGKLTALGKGTAAYASCRAQNAAHPDAARLARCLGRTAARITGGFAKLDVKYPGACAASGDDGGARNADAASYTAQLATDVGTAPGKCDAAKQRCVGKYAAAILACYSRAAKKDGDVDDAAGGCLDKAATKLANGVKGCLDKAAAAGGCTNAGSQSVVLRARADAFVDTEGCRLDPSGGGCETIPSPTPTATPSACPATIELEPDAGGAANDFDWGWTGIVHEQNVSSGATLTALVTGQSGPDCTFDGPIANAEAGNGTIDNQRCTGNTAVHCSNAPGGTGGPCTALGTCEFHWGPPLPLPAGGAEFCAVNVVPGGFHGTVSPVSGALTRSMALSRTVFDMEGLDFACPRCVGDGAANDGILGGTCEGGEREGLACDANGTTPLWPDYGATSLDCPPRKIYQAFTHTSTLLGSTGTASLVLTAASPRCTGGVTARCACDTCNNAAAEPCTSNADCPPSGGTAGVCGGRRCLGGPSNGSPCRLCVGGANDGSVCTSGANCAGGACLNPTCPGGGLCARLGNPTKPNGCFDDSTTPLDGSQCVDTAPVGDQQGSCPELPVEARCSESSGHPQRFCLSDDDCCDDTPDCDLDPATPGECQISARPCFLDNGVIGNAIVATGAADPPSGGVASPTIAQVFCTGSTASAFFNAASGAPGPGRMTLVETLRLLP